MIPYLLLLLFVIFVIILEENNLDINLRFNNFYLSIIFLISVIVFFCFYSLRIDVGYDYPMYSQIINQGTQEGYISRNEWGSYLLLDFAHENNSPELFFALIAAIAVPLYLFVLKYRNDCKNSLGWGLLLFLAMPIGLLQTLSVSRQFAAVACFLYAIKYIKKRKLFNYLLFIIIGMMFHFSTILTIPLYWIASERFRYRYFIYLFIVSYILIAPVAFFLVRNNFPLYSDYLQITFFDQGGLTQILMYVVLGIWFVFVKTYWQNNKWYNVYLKIYLYGMFFLITFSPFAGLLGVRLGFAGISCALLLFPYTLNVFKHYNGIIVKIIVGVVLMLVYFYSLSLTGEGTYLPYMTFL